MKTNAGLVKLCLLVCLCVLGAATGARAQQGNNNGYVSRAMQRIGTLAGRYPVDQQQIVHYRAMSVEKFVKNYPASGDEIKELTGTTSDEACKGFKNIEECFTAVYTAKDLGLNFDCLRSDVFGGPAQTGSNCAAGTGTRHQRIERAVETLKPGTDGKTEIAQAQAQAQQEVLYFAYGWK